MIRAVTFDAFGTVVDTGRDVLIQVARAATQDLRPSLDPEELLAVWDRYFFGADPKRFLTLREVTEDALARAFADLHLEADTAPYIEMLDAKWAEARAYPEVRDVLASLDGVPRAIVSNADHAMLLGILERNGLRFDAVVTSESVRSYKPRPRIFEVALESLHAASADVLHVGDSLQADVEGARRLGLRTAWVNRHGLRRTGADPAPDFEIPDLRRLPEIVASLRSE